MAPSRSDDWRALEVGTILEHLDDRPPKRISTHSLVVGLTQDLIADGLDGVAIAQALRLTAPSTALRGGARLKTRSGATVKALGAI